jgi:hypothetical protein
MPDIPLKVERCFGRKFYILLQGVGVIEATSPQKLDTRYCFVEDSSLNIKRILFYLNKWQVATSRYPVTAGTSEVGSDDGILPHEENARQPNPALIYYSSRKNRLNFDDA